MGNLNISSLVRGLHFKFDFHLYLLSNFLIHNGWDLNIMIVQKYGKFSFHLNSSGFDTYIATDDPVIVQPVNIQFSLGPDPVLARYPKVHLLDDLPLESGMRINICFQVIVIEVGLLQGRVKSLKGANRYGKAETPVLDIQHAY